MTFYILSLITLAYFTQWLLYTLRKIWCCILLYYIISPKRKKYIKKEKGSLLREICLMQWKIFLMQTSSKKIHQGMILGVYWREAADYSGRILWISASPCFSRVTTLTLLRSRTSPGAVVQFWSIGMKCMLPAFIMKQHDNPYCEFTTWADATEAISSADMGATLFTCHLPA